MSKFECLYSFNLCSMDLGCPLLRGSSDRRLRRCAATRLDRMKQSRELIFRKLLPQKLTSAVNIFHNQKKVAFRRHACTHNLLLICIGVFLFSRSGHFCDSCLNLPNLPFRRLTEDHLAY